MKYLLYAGMIVCIAGCATSGTITGRHFKDSEYRYSLTFPDAFELSNRGVHSPERVLAVKWRTDLSVSNKPTFAVTVYNGMRSLTDVIVQEGNRHFRPEYYMNCEIDYEEGTEVNGKDAYVVHYVGGHIEGKTVYVAFETFILKLEYIAEADFYSEAELIGVLESLIHSEE